MNSLSKKSISNLPPLAVILILLGTSFVGVHATVYYVDSTNGKDTNNGTSTSTAWQTLTNPNKTSFNPNPGDQVLFIRGGVWSGELNVHNSGTSTNPIIYGSYGNAGNPNPTINAGGSNIAAITIFGSLSYVTVENFSVTNFDDANITDGVEGNRNGIYVGEYPDIQTGISILNNEIYYVEGFSNSPSVGSPRGTTLDPNQNNQYGCAALFSHGNQMSNMTISGNYIHDCTGTGLLVLPNTSAGTTGLMVEDNLINNIGSDGIEIENSSGPIIQYNSCVGAANNSMGGTWPVAGYVGFHGLACVGMWSVNSSNVLFQYNYCEGTHQIEYDGEAWDFDHNLSGTCIYQYNYSRNNQGGFLLSTSTSTQEAINQGLTMIARYNISVDDGAKQGNGEGFFNNYCNSYYNNIFYRDDGLGFLMQSSLIGLFENNIFYTTATTNITYQTSTAIFNNNCFYGHTPVNPGSSALLANPLFVNATTAATGTAVADEEGFQLQQGSPALGTGVVIAGDTANGGGLDFWSDPFSGNTRNIGASAAGSLPTGFYSLTPNTLTSFRMDASNSGGAGSIVDMATSSGSASQNWVLTNLGGNTYEISPSYSPSLAVTTSGSANGSILNLAAYSAATTQKWIITQAQDGAYQLTPSNASTQFASAPNNGVSGTQLVTETLGGNYAQFWNLTSTSNAIIVDDASINGVAVTGSWGSSSSVSGYYGSDYLQDSDSGQGTKNVVFTPSLPATGSYQVYGRWTASSNRATNVPFTISYNGGTGTVTESQQANGGAWVLLGTYPFNAGATGSVKVSNTATNGVVVADAVEFVPLATVIVDDADSTGVSLTGSWTPSTSTTGYYGSDYLYTHGTGTVTFTPNLPTTGNYQVYGRWTATSGRATNVPFIITYNGGTQTVTENQQANGGTWVLLGTYAFTAGTTGNVQINTNGTNGTVISDAVQFIQQ